jgi:hypothetical protein
VATITVWEQDPGNASNPDGGALLHRQAPRPERTPFATTILGAVPPADNYQPGTQAFRYWTCADALHRASELWGKVLGKHGWNPAAGDGPLRIVLDEGTDLNAYYDRAALHFFHAAVGGRMIYSGESPDVVCHEHGHAVLDAIRPALWDVAAFEPQAFHESFGDIAAILTALQLLSVRIGVLQETNNKLYRSSRLSRLAEQLGWAIRQIRPDAVEGDCLRNAVNSHFYREPLSLPTSATAEELSSEAHSFSRVFTGACFEALALMFATLDTMTEEGLQQASFDMANILTKAIIDTPIVTSYFAQIGAHMITSAAQISSAYADAIKVALVKHGIMSVPGVAAVFRTSQIHLVAAAAAHTAQLSERELDVTAYGLRTAKIHAVTASQPRRFSIAGAAASIGDATLVNDDVAALGFFEDLIRRGRLDDGGFADPRAGVFELTPRMKTHKLVQEEDRVMLRRLRIDCGLHSKSIPGTGVPTDRATKP